MRVWFTGYYNPVKMIESLRSKPAPYWGFYGQPVPTGSARLTASLPPSRPHGANTPDTI